MNVQHQLTDLEKEIKDYISEHQGNTAYDLAEHFGQNKAVYNAIAYLIHNLHVKMDPRTAAIYPYDR